MTLGVRRLALISRGGGAGSASADSAGTAYTATGLKVGSSAILYGNGTQIATATVDGTGKATWALGSKPAAGTIITYDGVVVGSGGTVPAPVSSLGPTSASFTAGSITPIPITGLNSGETVASVTGSFTVSGNSIVPSAGLVAGSYSPVVTTNTGRTLTIAVTANAGASAAAVFGSPPPAYKGVPYFWQPLYVGPAGTQAWTHTLSLVAGLTVSATTGAISGTPTATGTISGNLTATVGASTGTLSNISFTSQEFYKQYTVSGVDPVRAFDYRNNLYWDGSTVTNNVAAFLTGATVTAGKGLLARLNIASIGAHLTGHQLAAKTVVMQLSGGSTTGGGDGILSYNGDAPLYRNGITGGSFVNSLRSYRVSGTAILDSMAPGTAVGGLANDGGSTSTTTKWSAPNWPKRARVATALNASGRKTTIGGSGIIHSDSSAFASPTAVTLLSFGTGYVYGGNDTGTTTPANSYLETEVIYGSYLSDADFIAVAAPRDAFEGKSGLAFPSRSYVAPLDANNSLKYSKTQPWYAYAIARADAYPVGLAATGNYHAGIIWTNSAGNPNGGYEGWIDGDGKLRVRIMSNFGGGDYIGVIGTTSLIDGVTHEIEFFYDGSGSYTGIKIALDGVYETLTKEPGSATTLSGDIIVNAAPYTIGNQLIGAGGSSEWQQAFMWPGRIDCFVQEKAARTTPFATGKFVPPPVNAGITELYYLFNEGTGTTTADLSGNNRTGTLSGTNLPVWVGA